mmetsp:Transcript_48826/g.157644  ORF Transcript_48826/g.157644 Transcript_48826/m.157644 type:complete len:207 (+) Transcript_48826:94-714(+)
MAMQEREEIGLWVDGQCPTSVRRKLDRARVGGSHSEPDLSTRRSTTGRWAVATPLRGGIDMRPMGGGLRVYISTTTSRRQSSRRAPTSDDVRGSGSACSGQLRRRRRPCSASGVGGRLVPTLALKVGGRPSEAQLSAKGRPGSWLEHPDEGPAQRGHPAKRERPGGQRHCRGQSCPGSPDGCRDASAEEPRGRSAERAPRPTGRSA